MTRTLTRRRLDWLLRARGTELSAWPNDEREGALALLRDSAEARALFAEALAWEDEPADAEPATLRRMQEALRRRLAPVPVAVRGLAVGVLAACMGAGLYLAVNTIEAEATPDLFNTAQTVSFAALDQ